MAATLTLAQTEPGFQVRSDGRKVSVARTAGSNPRVVVSMDFKEFEEQAAEGCWPADRDNEADTHLENAI